MRPRTAVAVAFAVLATACTGSNGPTTSSDPIAPTTIPAGLEPSSVVDGVVRTTSGDQTGNRVSTGTLDLDAEPWRVRLDSEPRWIVSGAIDSDRTVHVVVAEDGTVTAITVDQNGASTANLEPQSPETPPIGVFGGGGYRLVTAPDGASPLTAPAIIDSSTVWTTIDGEVSVDRDGESTPIPVTGLGDSRLAVDERGLLAVLSDPTGEYPHGVIGDRVESATVTIFDPVSAEILGEAEAPPGTVFETVAPMWADLDGDGDSELLLTASDAGEGARLVAYDERGAQLATSAPIGRGQRWRNQLGVAELGGSPTIVDVQTPHIGGIVQWFRLAGETLERVAAIGEYSSHRIGRRNLDQGLIADGNGDGVLDVVVPSQNQQVLAALSLVGGEPTEVRSVALGSRLSTNLSAVGTPDGGASLALGLEDGSVLLWP